MDATQFSSAPGDAPAAPSASTSGAPSHANADGDDSNAGGVKVWVLVLLFALLLLPFLPSAVRRGGTPWGGAAGGGGGGYRRGWISFKSGWDVVNLCLVLFAILCGLLGRSAGEGDGDPSPRARQQAAAGKKLLERQMATEAPGMDAVWESYGSAYPGGVQQQQHAGGSGIRRMKSTSSYPELRLGSDGVWALASPDAAWRFRDDAELYRARRPERTWDVHPQGRVKTIPVDTFVERRRGSPPRERRKSVERMAEVEGGRTRQKTVGAATSSRRWTVDAVPEQQQAAPPSPPPPPAPAPPRRRRGSLENFPRPEELEELRNPSQAPRRRRRSRSVENLPRPEEVLEEDVIIQEIRTPPPAAMVPPVTPPPPPPSTASRSTKKRSGSVGGAKELASAIALFYQKKRKSITMKAKRRPHHHHHHSDDHCSPPSSDASASPDATTNSTAPPPPPPPPPPPASIFSNLFKKGSKSRRIHSVAPPPPPPPPTTRRSRKPPTPPARPAPPAPPPPPVRPRAHAHTQQPPMYPRRVYYTYYPLPPPSPPLPPPPPPPLVSEGEVDAPSITASPAPAYCASPDVNAKADKFIESFREGLKLEKLNSYREKWQRQIQEEAVGADEDGEFMVIGSLFGDEDDVSLPETPAVAVGF